jgi:hypothetical protein
MAITTVRTATAIATYSVSSTKVMVAALGCPYQHSFVFRLTLIEIKKLAAWRTWLAKTGKDEETYRTLYGRPVDIGNESP